MSALPPISLFKERYGDVRYFMAPMAGITDLTFRTLIRELGAQVVISELVSSEGLIRGGDKTKSLMEFCDQERPVGIQIFGSKIDSMAEGAKIVQGAGADFVDINFGCPVKKVVKDGGGAAWLKDMVSLGKLLTTIKKGLQVPLTIKIRTGWDETSVNVLEVIRVAADCGVSWVAIHGRTRAQGYSGLADWEIIREAAQQSSIPIIGNGDILTAAQATARVTEGYAHGVMIGRGVLKNPWIFQEILGSAPSKYDFDGLINQHFDLAIANKGSYRAFLTLKKFMAWYASGYPGASQFRKNVFTTSDSSELRSFCLEYFNSIKDHIRVDDGKPFLMGGHG